MRRDVKNLILTKVDSNGLLSKISGYTLSDGTEVVFNAPIELPLNVSVKLALPDNLISLSSILLNVVYGVYGERFSVAMEWIGSSDFDGIHLAQRCSSSYQATFPTASNDDNSGIAVIPVTINSEYGNWLYFSDERIKAGMSVANATNLSFEPVAPTEPVTPTPTPSLFDQTVEQKNADKLTLEQITFKLRSGEFISDDNAVFFALGNSLMATAAMSCIDVGGGFDELRTLGLSQSQALRVLSVYNVTLDINKYQSEVKLDLLNTNPELIQSLKAYLSSLPTPITLPPLTSYLAQLRANNNIYSAIRGWVI